MGLQLQFSYVQKKKKREWLKQGSNTGPWKQLYTPRISLGSDGKEILLWLTSSACNHCRELKTITIINSGKQPLCKVTLMGQVPCPVLWLNNRAVHQIGAWGIHMLTFCLARLSPGCAAHRWHSWTPHSSEKKAKLKRKDFHSVSFYYQGSANLLRDGKSHEQILWKGMPKTEGHHPCSEKQGSDVVWIPARHEIYVLFWN